MTASLGSVREIRRAIGSSMIGGAWVLFFFGGCDQNCGGPTPEERCHGCKPGQIVICGDVCVTPIPRQGTCDRMLSPIAPKRARAGEIRTPRPNAFTAGARA